MQYTNISLFIIDQWSVYTYSKILQDDIYLLKIINIKLDEYFHKITTENYTINYY